MGALLDPVSVMMILVISFVSLMVQLFSLGYMKGEKRYSTYYAFLSLFTFSMLGLVVASNIFQLYVFWELVGISSYLLIGFYFDRPSAVAASKKAFIVTRFADLGLLIGILMLAYQSQTLDIATMIGRYTGQGGPGGVAIGKAGFLGISFLTWALALVFAGGAGKSAMFPLHIWLPDAMEGPTPVSALIHAATMVVAGVYLVARLFPVFSLDQAVLGLIAFVGAVSALLAAAIACTQTDIKRVLAYSTISQIGFMMVGLGVSGKGGEAGLGFSASLFHLFTHASFKSLLFLGAGAIIHAVGSNEMGEMGGLRRTLPLTHICFLSGCLAISGIPPFSGFFSKEEILLAAFSKNGFIFTLLLITSAITAFYIFRLYFSVFFRRPSRTIAHHPEAPLSMRFPLVVLALCALVAGFTDFPHWVSSDGIPLATHMDWQFSLVPVLLSLAAIATAYRLYGRENDLPARLSQRLGAVYLLVSRKLYFDELYLFITKKIIFNLVGRPAAWFDRQVVDGTVNGSARLTAWISRRIRGLQSGKLQLYTLSFFAGVALLALLLMYIWK